MGDALANLHLVSQKFICSIKHSRPTSLREERVGDLAHASTIPSVARAFLEHGSYTLTATDNLPVLHIHGDLFLSNVLWQDGAISAILDFDDFSYHWRLLDIAIPVWDMLLMNQISCARAFLRAYENKTPLEPQEKEFLLPLLTLVNYIRGNDQILLDRYDAQWERCLQLEERLQTMTYNDLFI